MEESLDSVRRARRFTRVAVGLMVLGLAASAAVALLVDPFHVFGTGLVPADIVNEREIKPALFLRETSPPEAIILGSSRAYKAKPACVQELTGLRTFNFGFGNSQVLDWVAVMRFVADRGRAPIRRLVWAVDVDAFDQHVDHRLETSSQLRKYVGKGGMSFEAVTRALFGQDALQYGLRSLWTYLRPSHGPPKNYFEADGFIRYPVWEGEHVESSPAREANLLRNLKRVRRRAADRFDQLDPERVRMFVELVRDAHSAGIAIDIFVPPLDPTLTAARASTQIAQRMVELDALLKQLDHEGVIHYLPAASTDHLGSDPTGFYDGEHMTETTTTKLLLLLFGREHGCGA